LLEDHKCTGLEDVSIPLVHSDSGYTSAVSDDASEELAEFGSGSPPNEPQWWLVGLDLDELGLTGLCSARKNRMSGMRRSSTRSARPSSGVSKRSKNVIATRRASSSSSS
jgi:hypothetical protein